jgi:hypothetical protein
MKKISTLLLLMSIALSSVAQQKSAAKHMVITIQDDGAVITIGKTPNMFITRDDTAQVKKYVNLKHYGSESKEIASREEQLMQLMEPYYQDGWKLVSTSAEAIYSTTVPSEVFRYYFIKE